MRELVLKHALKNALDHGKAQVGAVMSKVLGEDASLRAKAKDVAKEVSSVIKEIDKWPEAKKRAELEKLWPGAFAEKPKEERKGLPELPNAVRGRVHVRFAPNPNGPPTLGSSRGMVINHAYARMYDGRLTYRFDDTDPETKRPLLEAYDWYVEDAEWLGCKPDKVIAASDRIPEYYKAAKQLIDKGGAYVDECPAEEFRKLKAAGKACEHRGRSVKQNLELWQKMLDGKFEEGEAVLRVKTDMAHPDPAIRDWVAMRVLTEPHPRVGDKYVVWPLLDFESAIEDHLQGVTHIIRGKDLRDSTERQKYVYKCLGWEYPETLYWGRVAVLEFGKLSTSGIAAGIKAKKFSGWDDPRLPTIQALRRRGFDPEAIRLLWEQLGLSEKDVQISMEGLEALNRKLIDRRARRAFFVPEPVKISVSGIPKLTVELKNHPEIPELGSRKYSFDGKAEFFVSKSDLKNEFRLKDAFNVKKKGKAYEFAGREVTDAPKVQWAPADAVDAELVTLENKRVKGKAEPQLAKAKVNDLLQLERVGYARVDSARPLVLWFAHK
jgi:glutamyl-tRNA synthetase